MSKKVFQRFLSVSFTLMSLQAKAQYPPGDLWYENVLGFEPLKLHTSMGFLVPAAAVGVCMLVTKKNVELRNRFSIYSEFGMSYGYKYPHTFVPQSNTGFNFMLRRFMSVGTEFDMYWPNDRFNHTTGLAVRPFARFYLINHHKTRLYFESGGGLIFLRANFPAANDRDGRTGTQWNGTTKYGLGVEYKLFRNTWLLAGARHLHISNGNAKGSERNPSHDSNGFFAGLQITL